MGTGLPKLGRGDFYIKVSYRWVQEAQRALQRSWHLKRLMYELLNTLPTETAQMWKSKIAGIDTRIAEAYDGRQVNETDGSSSTAQTGSGTEGVMEKE